MEVLRRWLLALLVAIILVAGWDTQPEYSRTGTFDEVTVAGIKQELLEEYRVDISTLSNKDTLMVYRCIKQMYQANPDLTLLGLYHLKTVSYVDGANSNVYAQTWLLRGSIELNHSYFSGDYSALKVSYDMSVRQHWHPQGTTYEGIFIHEFGHIIDGAFRSEYTSRGYRVDSIVERAYMQSDVHYRSVQIWSRTISRYAAVNSAETVAEAWSEYVQNPNCSQASIDVVAEWDSELYTLIFGEVYADAYMLEDEVSYHWSDTYGGLTLFWDYHRTIPREIPELYLGLSQGNNI